MLLEQNSCQILEMVVIGWVCQTAPPTITRLGFSHFENRYVTCDVHHAACRSPSNFKNTSPTLKAVHSPGQVTASSSCYNTTKGRSTNGLAIMLNYTFLAA